MTNRNTPVPACYPDLELERELEQYAQRNAGRIGLDLVNLPHLHTRATVPAPAVDDLGIEVDVCFDSVQIAEAMVDDAAPETLRSGGEL